MNDHDFNRPYLTLDAMDTFTAVRAIDARRFGKIVKAFSLSNREYRHRYDRLSKQNNMKEPPSSVIHIMPGYLVVRNLGTPKQYETWIPDQVFEEIYQKKVEAVGKAKETGQTRSKDHS